MQKHQPHKTLRAHRPAKYQQHNKPLLGYFLQPPDKRKNKSYPNASLTQQKPWATAFSLTRQKTVNARPKSQVDSISRVRMNSLLINFYNPLLTVDQICLAVIKKLPHGKTTHLTEAESSILGYKVNKSAAHHVLGFALIAFSTKPYGSSCGSENRTTYSPL